MKVDVQMFAGARELAGSEHIEIELSAVASIGTLRAALVAEYPALSPLLPFSLFAINGRYATDDTQVVDGAEIACIPPVSGG